jgi:hypothetical protein
MRPTNTLRRALLLALMAVVTSVPVAAHAHNGVGAAFKGHAGPYTVYAYDGYQLPNGGVEYRLVLLTADGEPADDVTVRVAATRPGAARTTVNGRSYANVVFYDLPNPYPADWQIVLRLSGRAGKGRVTFRMHGFQPVDPNTLNQPIYTVSAGTPTGWIIGGSTAGAAVAAGAVLLWRRRRARRTSETTAHAIGTRLE